MHILIANNTAIPVSKYGGTERIIWWLGKELVKRGHRVSYLVSKGSSCPFADVFEYDPKRELDEQVPDHIDLVHAHFPINKPLSKPYIVTIHGNGKPAERYDINSVFISRNHAERHGSKTFVYNSLDWDDYGKVNWSTPREHFLFLAKASHKEKNLQDCITLSKKLSEKLVIVGGKGFHMNPRIKYLGYLGGSEKNNVINSSKALLFPVRWHEPFGLAILESMYFGCPVFGSTYGSLPELVRPSAGYLSNDLQDLQYAVRHWSDYNMLEIHEYARDNFSASQMTENYLQLYLQVLNGEKLNKSEPCSQFAKAVPLLPVF